MKFSLNKASACCTTPQKEGAHDCCVPQPKEKASCPQCGAHAKGVPTVTLTHLLTEDAKATLSSLEGFHYCKTHSCEVVYFRGEEILTQKDLTVTVGLKEAVSPATLCYCFDWTKEKIAEELRQTGKTSALEDIKAKMENPGCSCEILNPSGGCCLGDVTAAIKKLQIVS